MTNKNKSKIERDVLAKQLPKISHAYIDLKEEKKKHQQQQSFLLKTNWKLNIWVEVK